MLESNLSGVDMKMPKTFDEYKDGCECGEGWFNLIKPLYEEVVKGGGEILQIKEKFGVLRFYFHWETMPEGFYDKVMEAGRKSHSICEVCGEQGSVINDSGWIKTLCNKHHKEREKRNHELFGD